MNEKMEELLSEFTGNHPASADSLDLLNHLFSKFKKQLPTDLRDLLEVSDGGEGFIGENYLMFWGAQEIIEYNSSYQVNSYAPGLILFGSNGGGEAYAFDTRLVNILPVVQVPFIPLDLKYAEQKASTLIEFLEKLAE